MIAGKSPWRIVEHDGYRWMVREHDGATWAVRLPDRATWLFDGDAPAWTKVAEPEQQRLI